MKIYFLGTCAGTEPWPDRHHASFAVTVGSRVYWFDAGEGCSFTAHNLGLDLLSVTKIVISHTHMDHVGGLGNLLWNIRKMTKVKKNAPAFGDIDLYIPVLETYEGLSMLLRNTERKFEKNFEIYAHKVISGVLFDDGYMKVTAFHNTHLQKEETDSELSFSYLIEAEGKKVLYSGDLGEYSDLDGVLGEHEVDVLIAETGHFAIEHVYEYTKDKKIGKVIYFHNGKVIIKSPKDAVERVRELYGDKAIISYDGMIYEVV